MKRLAVLEDIHTPFVFGYDINVNEDDPKKVHFMYQYLSAENLNFDFDS
jgi:hypothetical protein